MKLKELAPYLATGIYSLRPDNKTKLKIIGARSNFVFFDDQGDCTIGDMEFVRLILHPLSDLTKPCLEGGKVPIVEMSGYSDISNCMMTSMGYDHKTHGYYAYFKIGVDLLRYDLPLSYKSMRVYDADWLYEHHFWLGDQSRFGQDIIDINTLKS